MMREDDSIVILTDDEGNEHEFEILQILEIDDVEYAILLSLDGEEDEEDEAIILRIGVDDSTGEEVLYDIEDDAEWEMVAQAWQQFADDDWDDED